eukprot:34671-Rhodomonas_salina.1
MLVAEASDVEDDVDAAKSDERVAVRDREALEPASARTGRGEEAKMRHCEESARRLFARSLAVLLLVGNKSSFALRFADLTCPDP